MVRYREKGGVNWGSPARWARCNTESLQEQSVLHRVREEARTSFSWVLRGQ